MWSQAWDEMTTSSRRLALVWATPPPACLPAALLAWGWNPVTQSRSCWKWVPQLTAVRLQQILWQLSRSTSPRRCAWAALWGRLQAYWTWIAWSLARWLTTLSSTWSPCRSTRLQCHVCRSPWSVLAPSWTSSLGSWPMRWRTTATAILREVPTSGTAFPLSMRRGATTRWPSKLKSERICSSAAWLQWPLSLVVRMVHPGSSSNGSLLSLVALL